MPQKIQPFHPSAVTTYRKAGSVDSSLVAAERSEAAMGILMTIAQSASAGRDWKAGVGNTLVPVLTLAVVLANAFLQSMIASSNARLIVGACQEYAAANGTYPDDLERLIPQFLKSVPRAKYCIGDSGRFIYRGGTDVHFLRGGVIPGTATTYFLEKIRWDSLVEAVADGNMPRAVQSRAAACLSLASENPFKPTVRFLYDPDLDRMLVREDDHCQIATPDNVGNLLRRIENPAQFKVVICVLHPDWDRNRLAVGQVREVIRRLHTARERHDFSVLREDLEAAELTSEPVVTQGIWHFQFAVLEGASIVQYKCAIDAQNRVREDRSVLVAGPENLMRRDALPTGALRRARAFLESIVAAHARKATE